MAISFVDGASGVNTFTMPAHEIGDTIIAIAFRDGSNSLPGLGTTFADILSTAGDSASFRVSYKVAAGTTETPGTWANATSVLAVIYRGGAADPIGASAQAGPGPGTIVTYPALTMEVTDSTSWVVGLAAHRVGTNALETPPTGMINRLFVADATDEEAGHDTDGGVASWSEQTVDIGGASSQWRAATIEILAAGAPPPPSDFLPRLSILGVG